MQGKVEICGVNTSRLKVLSQKEMDNLLRRSRDGDETARQELIEGNLRLVLSVIQRFSGRGESPDDLFQVGCIGLMKAVSNFDPDKQVRFSTYGVPMIAGEVRRYLRDNSAIRVSRSIRDIAYKVLQCKEALITDLGRDPTLEEIGAALELPVEEVSRALEVSARMLRYYEKQGLNQSSRRENYAYRVYDEANISRLRLILVLRHLRVPLPHFMIGGDNDDCQFRRNETVSPSGL